MPPPGTLQDPFQKHVLSFPSYVVYVSVPVHYIQQMYTHTQTLTLHIYIYVFICLFVYDVFCVEFKRYVQL